MSDNIQKQSSTATNQANKFGMPPLTLDDSNLVERQAGPSQEKGKASEGSKEISTSFNIDIRSPSSPEHTANKGAFEKTKHDIERMSGNTNGKHIISLCIIEYDQ